MLPAPPAQHPLGRPWGPADTRCGSCAWSRLRGPGPRKLRCLAHHHDRVSEDWRGCDRWEAPPDCLDCGACCGPAFDAVEVGARDPVRRLHPELIVCVDGRHQVRRTPTNHCAALLPDTRCVIYGDRPRCCRDFERLSDNCLFARRRLKLSPGWDDPRD